MLSAGLRRWVEIISLLVAAFCVVVAVVERLALTHWIARVETLLELAIVGVLVAIWTILDEWRTSRRGSSGTAGT